MTDINQAKKEQFKQLHESGCFIIPNPWDIGSAIYLQSLGFKALASTSSGQAWSNGQQDGALSLESVLEHLKQLNAATDLPINADFMDGLGATAEHVYVSTTKVIHTGVAGFSIEDTSHDANSPIRSVTESVERIQAACLAIKNNGADTLLVGRAENFLHGNPDLNDTVERLQAYAEAGADCLYAPGINKADDIKLLVKELAPKPINILIGANSEYSLSELADMGVRRISVGGALARVAWGAFQNTAKQLAAGKFTGFGNAAAYPDINNIFQTIPNSGTK